MKNKAKKTLKKRGKFIAIEGPDGAGKTKAIDFVKKELLELGFDFVFTREPGGTRTADEIRKIVKDPAYADMSVKCELGLFSSARADHLEKLIIPALLSGRNVFTDRFSGSTYVYQVEVAGEGKYEDFFAKTNKLFVGENEPDLWILLDVTSEEAQKRMQKRRQMELEEAKATGGALEKDKYDAKELDFHKKIRKGYHKFFKKFVKGKKGKLIDTTNKTEEEVGQEVLKTILSFLR